MHKFRYIYKAISVALLLVGFGSALADEVRKLPRIGQIWGLNESTAKPYEEAFRRGLSELGYVDGKNVTIVARYANGDAKKFPALVNEMIALNVDAMVVTEKAVVVSSRTTKSIPIVCPAMDDPIRIGLLSSLAHPGGNLTGLAAQATETDVKRLELAMELVPRLKRLAILVDGSDPRSQSQTTDSSSLTYLREQARALGVTVRTFKASSDAEVREALRGIEQYRAQALIVFATSLTLFHRDAIMSFAGTRLPVVSESRQMAQPGALIAYGADFVDMYRRGAEYVVKILKGAKPGDLPIEQPTKFELIVNLQTAKLLGISVPQAILLRADEVIQ